MTEQKNAILNKLKPAPDEHALVVFDKNDKEARQFANDLIEVLKAAGFPLETKGKYWSGAPSNGFSIWGMPSCDIRIYPPGSKIPPISGANVASVFLEAGVSTSLNSFNWQGGENKGLFMLYVGSNN
jgi:hypothetical protein